MSKQYQKIDIYVDRKYFRSTTQSRTCKEAVKRFKEAYPELAGKAFSIEATLAER